jgi:hypothetical protein
MKAPFHIEFQTEADGAPMAIVDAFFMVEVADSDTRQLGQLAHFLANGVDEVRDALEDEFGALDLQATEATSGTLLSFASSEMEPSRFKILTRKWKRAFDSAGFATGDLQVTDRAGFADILAGQTDAERTLIESIANGEVPAPRQESFAFRM